MLLFFVILCIIVLLPWTNSSSTNAFQSDSHKRAQNVNEKVIPGLNLEQKNNLLSSVPADQPQNDDNMPRLKVMLLKNFPLLHL